MDDWEHPPTLRGEHVFLRPTVPSDAELIAAAYDDDETFEYFPFGIESEPPTVASLMHSLASDRHTLTQIDLRSGAVIGSTSLYNIDRQRRRLTIGYTWLSRSARGAPFNLESKLLLLSHAFEVLGAVRVEFNVDNRNLRSRQAVLAIGASQEGVLRKHARRRDGTWRDTIVFSVIDDEWPDLQRRLAARVRSRASGRPAVRLANQS